MPDTNQILPAGERFRTFLDLSIPSDASPGFCANARVAYDAFRSDTEPWTSTLYAQRTTPLGFRRELAFALGPASDVEPKLPESPEVAGLLERAARPRELTPLKLAHLSRTLVYLGFPDAALSLVNARPAVPADSPEEAYWAYCGLFARHLFLDARSADGLAKDALRLQDSLNDDPRNLRVRLNSALLGLVWGARFTGHGGKPGPRGVSGWTDAAGGGAAATVNLRDWKAKVLEAWERVERSRAFSPFETAILHSRVFRATSFVPYFEGDFPALESEINSCLSLAREAKAADASEAAIKRDNLLATLESASRARSALGDADGALNLIHELTHSIEPRDAKPWLQLGELHEKQGHISDAERCFRRSALLAPPMGMIAWFKLGTCLERQGRDNEALDSYLSSLRAWPNGLSPLTRLLTLSRKTGNTAVHARTRHQLVRALSDPSLLPQSRAAIITALGGEPGEPS
jgi:tetratricopeptide (TPR) repeat protein